MRCGRSEAGGRGPAGPYATDAPGGASPLAAGGRVQKLHGAIHEVEAGPAGRRTFDETVNGTREQQRQNTSGQAEA